MNELKPVRYIAGRGLNVGGTGLFRDGDGLTMYPTRKMAVDFAKQFGWPAKYVCRVHTPLFSGYSVAQLLQDTAVFLQDDGETREAAFVDEKRKPLAIE